MLEPAYVLPNSKDMIKTTLIISFLLISLIAHAQYVNVTYGDIPVLITAEHDGNMRCGSLSHPGITKNDVGLSEHFNRVIDAVWQQIGHPYVIELKCRRHYVDANRYSGSRYAYNTNNSVARAAFYQYHDAINSAIADMEGRWGNNPGIGLNIHTFAPRSGINHQVLVGYDQPKYYWFRSSNTAQSLYDIHGVQALRQFYLHIDPIVETTQLTTILNGQSVGSLHGTNTTVSSSNVDSPGIKNSRWRRTLDFVTLEHEKYTSNWEIAVAEAEAVDYMLRNYYGWGQACRQECVEYETICD